MLIFQFTVATSLLLVHIVYQQIDYLTNKDLGFKGDQVIEINLNFPNWIMKWKT
jgi:putative ABC transport system permease protein